MSPYRDSKRYGRNTENTCPQYDIPPLFTPAILPIIFPSPSFYPLPTFASDGHHLDTNFELSPFHVTQGGAGCSPQDSRASPSHAESPACSPHFSTRVDVSPSIASCPCIPLSASPRRTDWKNLRGSRTPSITRGPRGCHVLDRPGQRRDVRPAFTASRPTVDRAWILLIGRCDCPV